MKQQNTQVSRAVALGIAGALVLAAQLAVAGPNERAAAKRMYDAIAGVPPSETTLNTMEGMINLSDKASLAAAAMLATDDAAFYNVTLKNLATPWTNRDQTVFAPLNDYTATVVGMVRDNKPFNTVLSADTLYTFNDGSLPAVSANGNDHYEQAEMRNLDMSDKNKLVETQQSTVYGTLTGATAGLLTTRAASAAFFIAGTNRAQFRFTMLNQLCHDMETVHDTTRPPDRIRQDVSRSPGGDSRLFLNNCIGCHSGMDPMAQAFAYYNYDGMDASAGKLVYTPGAVQAKYFINSDNFKTGFITPDDSWENRWRHGPNTVLGWDPALPGSGSGAKSLGEELANSQAFAECQVQKVFKAVCFRTPASNADRAAVESIAGDFKASKYNLKTVFAETAANCKAN